jgi:hypothetical protein
MDRLRYLLPRLLGIAAILFISLFALDAFAGDAPLPAQLQAFAMHLLPSLVPLLLLVIAWRWEMVGGALYVLASALPFLLLRNPAGVNAMLAAPFVLTGIVFIASALGWPPSRRAPPPGDGD